MYPSRRWSVEPGTSINEKLRTIPARSSMIVRLPRKRKGRTLIQQTQDLLINTIHRQRVVRTEYAIQGSTINNFAVVPSPPTSLPIVTNAICNVQHIRVSSRMSCKHSLTIWTVRGLEQVTSSQGNATNLREPYAFLVFTSLGTQGNRLRVTRYTHVAGAYWEVVLPRVQG